MLVRPPTSILLLALVAVPALVAACAVERDAGAPLQAAHDPSPAADGRLTARPRRVVRPARRGRMRLEHGAELFVPRSYAPARPAALVLTLHGANGGPANGFGQLLPLADDAGLILLAPKSTRGSWDVVRGGYGPDVVAIDDLLGDVFRRYAIDRRRVFVSGFSDGASYALSLGLTNGDLFRAIAAFSPGFVAPGPLHGKPRVFISHGTQDTTLPIGATSRRIVPDLRKRGYDVTCREFAGPHTVRPATAREAVSWLLTAR